MAWLPAGFFLTREPSTNGSAEWLTKHPDIDAITFADNSKTGRATMKVVTMHPVQIDTSVSALQAGSDAESHVAVAPCVRLRHGVLCAATARRTSHERDPCRVGFRDS